MRLASQRFHLVGVGGAGMSGLARLLHDHAADVTGCDSTPNATLHALQAEGLDVWTGHDAGRIRGENGYVVRSAAVPLDDDDVRQCERQGFTSLLYAEAVGRLSEGKQTLAIAGTHGKTTTTALTVCALRGASLDPSHLIGGEIPELGGNGHGGSSEHFVVEACEFNRSFHQLRPFGAAILNVEPDHFDCYPTTAELEGAFRAYLQGVRPGGVAIVHETVPEDVTHELGGDVRVLRVGEGLYADLRASDVADDFGRYSFTPVVERERLPRIQLSVSGRFQIMNALSALGLAMSAGADPEGACRGIGEFGGVRRRFEMHEGRCGARLINDYAHHPSEIRAVLHAARRRFPGKRIFVAFQPHQHQRTLCLLEQFADVLAEADRVFVLDIYGARESAEIKSKVSASDLVSAVLRRGGTCEPGGGVSDLPGRLRGTVNRDDLLLLLGAGDIDRVLDDVVAVI
jgi:UDP-N-acetylmuramate--alanine ligase